MRTTTKSLSKSNKFILTSSLVLVIVGIGFIWYSSISPQKIGINLVGSSTIQYGNTMLTGRLIKDTPVGKDGTYLLNTSDGLAVILSNVTGMDPLVGENVVVNGFVNPPSSANLPPVMDVATIILEN